MEPPAPGRLSTITGIFHTSPSFLPSSRAKVSFEPPAGYGTMIVTGLPGNLGGANAGPASAATAASSTATTFDLIRFSSLFDSAHLGDQSELAGELEDGLGAAHERRVDHAAVDGEGADAFLGGARGGVDHLERVGDLRVGGAEDGVGDRHLRGMDRALADVAQAARALGLAAVAFRVLDVRERAVAGP